MAQTDIDREREKLGQREAEKSNRKRDWMAEFDVNGDE